MRGSRQRALHPAGRALRVGVPGVPLICGSSARKRFLQLLQSTSGSVKPATCPLASHTRGCMRIAASSPSMSSRDADHRVPPAILDVPLELHAQRPVVPHRTRAAVDLGGLEDEAAPLAQRHELFHHVGKGAGRHGTRMWMRCGGPAVHCRQSAARRLQLAAGCDRQPQLLNLNPYATIRQESSSALNFGGGGAARPCRRATIRSPWYAAVLDEHLVRVESGHHHPRDEHAGHRGLQRLGVVRRNAGGRRRSARRCRGSSARFGRESRHHVDAGTPGSRRSPSGVAHDDRRRLDRATRARSTGPRCSLPSPGSRSRAAPTA